MAKQETRSRKLFKLFLKILVTVICFWYISRKINWTEAWTTISSAKWYWLLPALIFFVSSKVVSAFRLNIYFKNAGVELSPVQNLKLYWLGMFYNLFLPGSISGDAYKVILLKKKQDASYKKTSSAVLLDRFSGLLGLGFILAGFSIPVLKKPLYIFLIIAAALIAFAVLYFIIRRWLKEFLVSFMPTFLLGIIVQGLQVFSIYFILRSVGMIEHLTEYIFVFLISSVVSVLPLTIGGLGIREVVFLEGSKFFGLSRELSVGVSLLFYLLTLLSSAFGSFYVFTDPLKTKKDPLLDP